MFLQSFLAMVAHIARRLARRRSLTACDSSDDLSKEASCAGSEDTADTSHCKGQQSSQEAAHPALLSLQQAAPVPFHHAGA